MPCSGWHERQPHGGICPRSWAVAGVWQSLFKGLAETPDSEYVLVDATISKVHADATGQKRGAEAHGIGRSKGGLTSKTHASVDALGNPLRFEISAGQIHDSKYALPVLEGFTQAQNILADMAYDADYIRNFILNDLKAHAIVPSHLARAIAIPMDKDIYKERHLIECFFNKIKRFRRIALR